MAQPLQIRAATGAFAPIGGIASPTPLALFDGPVSGANVADRVSSSRSAPPTVCGPGPYSKTLTFTLSTTTP